MGSKRAKRSADPSPPAITKPGDCVEVSFDGATLNLYQAPGGGVSTDYTALDPRSLESVTAFLQQGLFLPLMFEEDNGCTVRFRLGEADEREADEWIGRVVSKLDLRSGRLGCNGTELAVLPDEYLVEVCLYLPSTSAGRILSLSAGKKDEAVWDYWMRTRPGAVLPSWMVEAATSQDEEVVPAELLPADDESDPFAHVRVKVGRKSRPLPRTNSVSYVDVVVRLAPLPMELEQPVVTQDGFCWGGRVKPKVRSSPLSTCFCPWEGRKPRRCPAGLPGQAFHA